LEQHPVTAVKKMQSHELSPWIRHWFWEVHEWVNMTLSKPSFPEEELSARYAGMNLRPRLRGLDIPMNRAIRVSGNQLKKYGEWKAKYMMILSVLGL
jgi:hypothetical protein